MTTSETHLTSMRGELNFEVSGVDRQELEIRADEVIRAFFGGLMGDVRFHLDARPLIQANDASTPLRYQAEVRATW